MEIIVYENSLRAQALLEILRTSDALTSYDRALVLPIPSSRDGVHINGSETTLGSFSAGVGQGDLVLCYGLSPKVRDGLAERGCEAFDAAFDEDFLRENARLTAEATVEILLGNGERSLSDLNVGIIGYGRIGMALAEMLLYFGAKVTVYTLREEVAMELSSFGVRALGYDGPIPSDLDYLVNTAPSDAFYRASGEELIGSGVPVIELASGENFGEGVDLRKYPSLPARRFPISAGEAWSRAVLRFVSREKRQIRGDAI